MTSPYPRDLVGYGGRPPRVQWPNGARVALSFVLNYEEGGEASILDGDKASEAYVQEIVGLQPSVGQRNLAVESVFEYGSRAGFWRVLRQFTDRGLPLTVWAVTQALERAPEAGRAMARAGWEVASHSYRWIDYANVPEEIERDHIQRAITVTQAIVGQRPVGWYTGRMSANTRRLVVEAGGFLYDSDSYADDLPYWVEVAGKPHLVLPYSFDNNDFKFCVYNGFATGGDFFEYLKDALDVFREEGEEQPQMMSVGLHCRIVGRPGRARSLARFLDHVKSLPDVWVARRAEIARHWVTHHPFGSR